MKVIRATTAGFCFGVKRALDMAERTAETSVTSSLGPIIHNTQVVNRLAEKGIQAVNSVTEATPGQTLIIRSHGVAPHVYKEAEEQGMKVVDATCPFVQKAQRIAAQFAPSSQIVVVGDKNHPEVQGILGWAGEGAISLETIEEAQKLPFYPRITVLSQTTQPIKNFNDIVEELRKHTDELDTHNTICNATEERQLAARELAESVDVMVVVGDRKSSNTKKLATICSEKTTTHLIEMASELEEAWFEGCNLAGITAGASTPDWIIEEVFNKMSEMNAKDVAAVEEISEQENQELDMTNWDQGLPKLHRGAVVTGKVVSIKNDEVFVDIGWKSEGVISQAELAVSLKRPEEVVSVGENITAVVLRVENEEGYAVLSKRRADEFNAAERLGKLVETNEEIQAKVTAAVKGGVIVDVGMRGFVPASQIQMGYIEDLNTFVGQTLRLRVIEFDPAKKRVVLSQKAILAEEQAAKRTTLMVALQEGEIVTGVVRRLANFGAFVDIGGVDGLLHISDMAYTRIKHPSEVLNPGDEVEVQVLKIERESGKVSLGLKQLKPTPWAGVAEKYAVGEIVTGKVVRLAAFGAFVQLEDGVDALVHISQLADKRVMKVEDVVKVGDMISAKVIECKPEEKRISLSIREAQADAQKAIAAEVLAEQPDVPEVTIGDALNQDSVMGKEE